MTVTDNNLLTNLKKNYGTEYKYREHVCFRFTYI